MAQCYDYVNPFAPDDERIEYGFSRKADAVIFALSTNDTSTGTELQDAIEAMIDMIRARNGADVKIVILDNMMNSIHKTELQAAAQAKGTYYLCVTQDRNGINNHPSVAGHEVFAQELTAFLRTIL